jgi:hypothetical protein
MRRTLLALTILGTIFAVTDPASAGSSVLGWHRGRPCHSFGPPVAAYPYPYYPAPVYQPYAYGPSYFRPEAPYAWNAQRNWRDTWQDDGVKVHSYTLR